MHGHADVALAHVHIASFTVQPHITRPTADDVDVPFHCIPTTDRHVPAFLSTFYPAIIQQDVNGIEDQVALVLVLYSQLKRQLLAGYTCLACGSHRGEHLIL